MKSAAEITKIIKSDFETEALATLKNKHEIELNYQEDKYQTLRSQVGILEKEINKDNQATLIKNLEVDNTLLERKVYLLKMPWIIGGAIGVTWLTMYLLGVA